MRRRLQSLAALVILTLSLGTTPARAGDHVQFEPVATVPGAAAQPTPTGRAIRVLTAWQGALYAGYGDYGANTGPIAITSYTPATRQIRVAHVQDTEAVHVLRVLGDELYSPSIDTRGGGDFAVGEPWRERDVAQTFHVFDVARRGNELFLGGSTAGCGSSCGAVWRSQDGGATWSLSYIDQAHSQRHGGLRCSHMSVLADRVYVDCHTGSYVHSGGRWRPGPSGLGSADSTVTFQDMIVGPHENGLGAFDGESVHRLRDRPPHAVATAGGRLFVLEPSGIYVASNIDRRDTLLEQLISPPQWERIAPAPPGATTLALLDGYLYVGDSDSQILRSTTTVY